MRIVVTVITLLLPPVAGSTNPQVTQATLATTVCHPGWTTTVRPPLSYTEPLKRRLLKTSGFKDQKLGDYELDHLIPLELGGATRDPNNLWLEPRYNGQSQRGDNLENALRRKVCLGTVTLQQARDQMVTYKHTHG